LNVFFVDSRRKYWFKFDEDEPYLIPCSRAVRFLNNTPIIALLIPAVKSWCKRNNIASSRFLLPLSYAAILGGTCTLIGTSTNLVIHGFLINRGYEGFSFFELALVGVPVAVIGILLVSFFGSSDFLMGTGRKR
jgi:di/tricarboxylate transporter